MTDSGVIGPWGWCVVVGNAVQYAGRPGGKVANLASFSSGRKIPYFLGIVVILLPVYS
jgi:hypothetical protein